MFLDILFTISSGEPNQQIIILTVNALSPSVSPSSFSKEVVHTCTELSWTSLLAWPSVSFWKNEPSHSTKTIIVRSPTSKHAPRETLSRPDQTRPGRSTSKVRAHGRRASGAANGKVGRNPYKNWPKVKSLGRTHPIWRRRRALPRFPNRRIPARERSKTIVARSRTSIETIGLTAASIDGDG